jgi:iron complex transport system substrate-binding protein
MSRISHSRFRPAVALLGLSLAVLAGCGSDAPTAANTGSVAPDRIAASSTTEVASLTTEVAYSAADANGTVTLSSKPVKIISLSPTHTEMLFAIGAGSQVIAVDDQSNFPAEVAAAKSDLSGFTPSVEAIAGFKPDLVVIGDDSAKLSEQLAQVGIPVWFGPSAASLDDVYAQINQLGALTGNGEAASALVAKMTADIASIIADAPKVSKPLTYYHELDSTYFSATSNTFVGQLYAMAGLRNIADTAESGNDYPQLSAEFIVSQNPDIVFLADTKCCQQDAATVTARDGWSQVNAVKNGNVVAMDDDIASRWGPRVVDYLRAIVDAVNTASAGSAG